MEPLQSVPVPTTAVLVAIDTANSWPSESDGTIVRLAYIATDSTERLSFVSLQSATHPAHVLHIASRPSRFDDMPYGVVVEVYLAQDIAGADTVTLALAHAGATVYYPPQEIDDTNNG